MSEPKQLELDFGEGPGEHYVKLTETMVHDLARYQLVNTSIALHAERDRDHAEALYRKHEEALFKISNTILRDIATQLMKNPQYVEYMQRINATAEKAALSVVGASSVTH